MKCHHLSTLAETFVEKVVALEQDFTSLSGFYVGADAAAPVLPKLCGGMVFPRKAVRYNKDVPERQKIGA